MPPSTVSTCPVMYFASALAKKATALAMSAGSPNLPSGIWLITPVLSASGSTSLAAGQLIQTAADSASGTVDGSQNSKAKVVIGAAALHFAVKVGFPVADGGSLVGADASVFDLSSINSVGSYAQWASYNSASYNGTGSINNFIGSNGLDFRS